MNETTRSQPETGAQAEAAVAATTAVAAAELNLAEMRKRVAEADAAERKAYETAVIANSQACKAKIDAVLKEHGCALAQTQPVEISGGYVFPIGGGTEPIQVPRGLFIPAEFAPFIRPQEVKP